MPLTVSFWFKFYCFENGQIRVQDEIFSFSRHFQLGTIYYRTISPISHVLTFLVDFTIFSTKYSCFELCYFVWQITTLSVGHDLLPFLSSNSDKIRYAPCIQQYAWMLLGVFEFHFFSSKYSFLHQLHHYLNKWCSYRHFQFHPSDLDEIMRPRKRSLPQTKKKKKTNRVALYMRQPLVSISYCGTISSYIQQSFSHLWIFFFIVLIFYKKYNFFIARNLKISFFFFKESLFFVTSFT